MDIQNVVATVAAVVVPKLDTAFATSLSSELDKATGNATANLEKKLSTSFSNIGGSLTRNLTVPIVGAIGATVAAGTAVDGYYDTIQTKTGLTGEALAGLQDSFRNVGKTTSQDLGGIADTISILNQRLGLTGAPLEGLTKQIADLQQVTGVSADLDNLTRTISAFNIPSEQAGEALDKVFRASQLSGVEFNRLTSLAVTQSAAFSELGFTFDETISLLAKFEESGVNTETVLAGLKASIVKSTKGTDLEKVQTRLSEVQTKLGESTLDLEAKQAKYNETVGKYGKGGSQALAAEAALVKAQNDRNALTAEAKTLQDQLNASGVGGATGAKAFFTEGVKQIEAYLAAGKTAEAQTLASEVFGAKTFADALDAIRRGQFNVDDYVTELSTAGGAIQNTAKDTADYTESLAALRNQATIALGDIGTKLFPILTDAIQTIVPPLVTLVEKFAALPEPVQKTVFAFAGFAAAAGPVLSITGKISSGLSGLAKIGPVVTKGLSGLSSGFSSLLAIPPVAWGVILGVAAVIAIVVLIVKNWDKIKEALAKAVEFMSKVWAGFVEGLKMLGRTIVSFYVGYWKAILAGLSAIVSGIKTVWNGIVSFFKTVGSAIVSFYVGYWKALYAAFKFVVDGIRAIWDAAFAFIRAIVSGAISFISGVWNTLTSIIATPINVAVTLVTGSFDIVKSIISGAVSFISGLWSTVTSILTAPFDLFGSAVRVVVDTVKSLFSSLRDAIDSALGPLDELLGKVAQLGGGVVSWVGDQIAGRAVGGPVSAGTPYMVGERGPELIVPRSAGTVIPNNALTGVVGRGAATYSIEINNPKAEPSSTSIPTALRRAAQLRG
jgi:phage-related minor tail protein